MYVTFLAYTGKHVIEDDTGLVAGIKSTLTGQKESADDVKHELKPTSSANTSSSQQADKAAKSASDATTSTTKRKMCV